MGNKNRNPISRKEFLNRSTGALFGVGIAGSSVPAFIKEVHAAP